MTDHSNEEHSNIGQEFPSSISPSFLQNIMKGGEGTPQYNEIVAALFSAISKGEAASFKIGSQTISINITNEGNNSSQLHDKQPSNVEIPNEPRNVETKIDKSSPEDDSQSLEILGQESDQAKQLQQQKENSESKDLETQGNNDVDQMKNLDITQITPKKSSKIESLGKAEQIQETNELMENGENEGTQVEIKENQETPLDSCSSKKKAEEENLSQISQIGLVKESSPEKTKPETETQSQVEANKEETADIITSPEKNKEKSEKERQSDRQTQELLEDETKDSIVDTEEEKDKIDASNLLDELLKIEAPLMRDPLYQRIKKIANQLHEKEKNLENREKKIEEQMQVLAEGRSLSLSSTQLSTETYSTGFNKNSKELQQIINEAMNDLQGNHLTPSGEISITSSSATCYSPGPDLHFAFMFSQPLVLCYIDSQQNVQKSSVLLQVEHSAEQETVKSILRNAKNEVKYRSFAATQAGLGECLNMKPRAIHFCGHGVKNSQENFLFMKDEEGDFLIFEDEEGKADFMSCRALKNLLREKKLEDSIDFVFVASCHSYLVGQVFRDAGAKHVICVKRDEKILDKACQEFTKHFYQAYFTGNYNVCEAFCNAKEHLRSIRGLPPGEENKFVILFEESLFQMHECSSFFPTDSHRPENGHKGLKDLTPVPLFHRIPSKVEHFMGRHMELHEVIKLVRSQRFVTIKGIPGVGKSSLCRETANFLLERNVFQDGIIYLPLGGCDSIEGIISALDSKLGYLSKDVNSKKESVGTIISQVADYLDDKVRDALIILDNVDQVHHKERAKLRELIEMILLTCSKVKILVTSRSPIGGGFQDAAEKLLTVTHLETKYARELFFSKSPRPINDSEIKEFLEYQLTSSEEAFLPTNNNYPDHPYNRTKSQTTGHSSFSSHVNSFHTQLCISNKGPSHQTFERHHLMQILGGHPQAISLAAGLLVERSLKDLYKLLLAHPILDVLKAEDLTEDEVKSMNSMQVSLDVSVNYLKKSHKDAVKFFGLLGFLPGGAQDVDLTVIWGKDWEEHIRLLLRYSLIIKSEKSYGPLNTRYLLYPFMVDYAEKRLKKTELIEFKQKVLLHLRDKAQKIYNKVGSISPDSHTMFDIFLQEETNFKACIKRELEAFARQKRVANPVNTQDEESDDSTFALTKENLNLLIKYSLGKQKQVKKALHPSTVDGDEAKLTEEQEDDDKAKLSSDLEFEKPVIGTENVAQLLGPLNQDSQSQSVMTGGKRTPRKSDTSCGSLSVSENMKKEEKKDKLSKSVTKPRKRDPSTFSDDISGIQQETKSRQENEGKQILGKDDPDFEIQDKSQSSTNNQNQKQEEIAHPDQRKSLVISSIPSLTGSSLVNNLSTPSQQNKKVLKSPRTDHSVNFTGAESLSIYSGNDEMSDDNKSRTNSNTISPIKENNRFYTDPVSPIFRVQNDQSHSSVKPYDDENELQDTPRFTLVGSAMEETENFKDDALEHNCEGNLTFFDIISHTAPEEEPKTESQELDVLSKSVVAEDQDKAAIELEPKSKSIDKTVQKTQTQVSKGSSAALGKQGTRVTQDSTPNKIAKGVVQLGKLSTTLKERNEKSLDGQKNTEQKISIANTGKLMSFIEEEDENYAPSVSMNNEKELSKTSKIIQKKAFVVGKPVNAVTGSSQSKTNAEKKPVFLLPSEKKKTMQPATHLAVLHCSTLFLLRRFNECEKLIVQGLELCKYYKDKLGEANFLKLRGCINWIKKNYQISFKNFNEALNLFRITGCALGQAICDAAIGYLKAHMLPEESTLNAAIKKLEASLSTYKHLDHWFGIHYMHRWLSIVKNKIPYYKAQCKQHSEEARRVLNLTNKKKDIYGSRHSAGYFVLRWMGDVFSIFLEVATVCDVESVKKVKEDQEISDTAVFNLMMSRSKLRQRFGFNSTKTGRNSLLSSKTDESEEGRDYQKGKGRSGTTSGVESVDSMKDSVRTRNTKNVPPSKIAPQKKVISNKMLMPSLRQSKVTKDNEDLKEVQEEEKIEKESEEPMKESRKSWIREEKHTKFGVKLNLEVEDFSEKPKIGKAVKTTPSSKTGMIEKAIPEKVAETEKKKENVGVHSGKIEQIQGSNPVHSTNELNLKQQKPPSVKKPEKKEAKPWIW